MFLSGSNHTFQYLKREHLDSVVFVQYIVNTLVWTAEDVRYHATRAFDPFHFAAGAYAKFVAHVLASLR